MHTLQILWDTDRHDTCREKGKAQISFFLFRCRLFLLPLLRLNRWCDRLDRKHTPYKELFRIWAHAYPFLHLVP